MKSVRSLSRLSLILCSLSVVAGSPALAQEEAEESKPLRLEQRVFTDRRELTRKGPKLTSYADVLDDAKKSVVRIFTEKVARRSRGQFAEDRWFERMRPFGDREQAPGEPMTGLGSGILISKDGYILTNNHVITGADLIQVEVPGRKERPNAIVIGADPDSDIAVIKIDGEGYPRAVLTDSSKSRVGDIVFAIRSPFNYPQTVSMGIISALGRTHVNIIERSDGSAGYENFIQTDASINPGNSGGALVDAFGRVVAVNTAIASNTGGSLGIGFAIPINMAMRIAEGLVDSGEVQRGYLGISMEDVKKGVVVRKIQPGSPAEFAGLQINDVITKLDGMRVKDLATLRLDIAATTPGTRVVFDVFRDGSSRHVPVVLARKTAAGFELIGEPGPHAPDQPKGFLTAGVEVEELEKGALKALGLGAQHVGLIVSQVDPASDAARAGLARGDLIAEIDQEPVANIAAAREQVRKAGKIVVFRIFSGGEDRYLALPLR